MASEPLRTQLLRVIEQSQTTTTEVRNEVAKVLAVEQAFKKEEAELQASTAAKAQRAPSSAANWGQWDVDVLYCGNPTDGTPEQAQAKALVAALKDAGAKGRIRARYLPNTINAHPAYSIVGYEIRYDANEAEQAKTLQQLASNTFSGVTFSLKQSSQATARYLSAFVCPQR